jgi:thymidylate synthase
MSWRVVLRLFEAPEFHIAYRNLLSFLYKHSSKVAPRGMATRELLGVTFHVHRSRGNIIHHPLRNANYKFMVAEWLWIMSGSDKLDEIAQYNSKLAQFSDDGKVLNGAYGKRLSTGDQLTAAIERLKLDPFTRQAVAVIWKQGEQESKDVPCTVAIQFLLRAGKLNAIVTMRSSDIWLGLTYDFYVFSQMLNCFAGELGVESGFLQFNLGSSHMYDRDAEKIAEVLENSRDLRVLESGKLDGFPPAKLIELFQTPHKEFRTSDFPPPWGVFASVLTLPRDQAILELSK